MVLTLPDSYVTPWHGAKHYHMRALLPGMVLTLPDLYITPWDVAKITRFVYYSLA